MGETERLQPLGAGRGAKSQDNPLQTNSPRRNEGLEGKLAKKATCREKLYKSFLPPQLEQKLKSELIRRGQLTRQRKQTECDKTHRRESKPHKKRERPVPRTYASIILQRAKIPLTRNFRTQKNKKIAERRLT